MRNVLTAAAIIAATGAPALAQEKPLRDLAERFAAARSGYDAEALDATLAPDYEEISPVGTVDKRTDVIGFYTPDKKAPVPPMTADEWAVAAKGNFAIVTLRQSLTLPNGMTRSLRVRHVARQDAGKWRLVSTQYTPIPPARP
ncbi:nuclear transport factor 2 family protein [uncultured Sphingomonas sp.]|uniref:nuclear transport factor 2 family protein n=1 Tax=uncultured Sphingomonas sp. TaxID=158754 RepID=UPI0025F97F81|nr:nuclear transport factor 2 family protein [uncultured Sphingomonas sp.]